MCVGVCLCELSQALVHVFIRRINFLLNNKKKKKKKKKHS